MKLLIASTVALVLLQQISAKFPKYDRTKIHQNGPFKAPTGQLILTDYIAENKINEARNASQVNYAGFQNVSSYAGYFTVDKTYNSNLFFWYFPAQNNFDEAPVVLWLQGGPGSPSLYGLFEEHGPFIVDKDLNVSLREYSWHKDHSILYIDSPAGTGFSYTSGGFAQNETKVGADLYSALIQFFTVFPELAEKPFFISGESYGGKYVPALSYTIHQNNPTADLKIKFQGALIGNGWSDPENMFLYSDFVYQLGLIDINTRDEIKAVEAEAVQLIREGNFTQATQKFQDIILGGDDSIYQKNTGLSNIYNYVNDNEEPSYWESLISQDEVSQALHVGTAEFGEQSGLVYDYLWDDITVSVAPWIAELLGHHRFLIFNGQLDVIVSYPLTVNYLQRLNFSSAEEYKVAERGIWKVDGKVAGYVKTAGNLTEALVRDASHMVPIEQPAAAYDLLYKFVRNLPLV
ncbi:venom serine carboxypeptidase-like [Sitophilus oryzae]|uniref:Carboxypeptidase n=1 Tax=Sitophilus oryzae TaxID=7048 RepID=A0A6J2X177_SITOR|nr:venom serine carboxypeptidase-like [Sitophilus oryzae]